MPRGLCTWMDLMMLIRLQSGALDCCEDVKELGLRCMSLREGMFDSPSSAPRPEANLISVCLARGRSYTVPPTTLIENCDRWHLSTIADPRDGPMNSMAVLRRDLVGAIPNPVLTRLAILVLCH